MNIYRYARLIYVYYDYIKLYDLVINVTITSSFKESNLKVNWFTNNLNALVIKLPIDFVWSQIEYSDCYFIFANKTRDNNSAK